MKVSLKITDDRPVSTIDRQFRGPTVEPYTVVEVADTEANARTLGGMLRAIADDIDPFVPEPEPLQIDSTEVAREVARAVRQMGRLS